MHMPGNTQLSETTLPSFTPTNLKSQLQKLETHVLLNLLSYLRAAYWSKDAEYCPSVTYAELTASAKHEWAIRSITLRRTPFQ